MIGRDLAVLAGSFAAATLLAEALGATNLGTSLTFGAMALLLAVLGLMLLSHDR